MVILPSPLCLIVSYLATTLGGESRKNERELSWLRGDLCANLRGLKEMVPAVPAARLWTIPIPVSVRWPRVMWLLRRAVPPTLKLKREPRVKDQRSGQSGLFSKGVIIYIARGPNRICEPQRCRKSLFRSTRSLRQGSNLTMQFLIMNKLIPTLWRTSYAE